MGLGFEGNRDQSPILRMVFRRIVWAGSPQETHPSIIVKILSQWICKNHRGGAMQSAIKTPPPTGFIAIADRLVTS